MRKRTGFFAALLMVAAGSVQAHTVVYTTTLSGPAEAPPNASPGIGTGTVTFDFDLVTMRVQANFSGLTGNVSAAHIHGATATPFTGTAGVMTPLPSFPGFPSGVTSGSYDQTFDMTLASSYNPSFVTANGGTVSGALNAITAALDNGKAYLNIHTSAFSGGEIRGFFVVPEPSSALLATCGLALISRRRRA